MRDIMIDTNFEKVRKTNKILREGVLKRPAKNVGVKIELDD